MGLLGVQTSTNATSNRFQQSFMENRRKGSQAMAQMASNDMRQVNASREKSTPTKMLLNRSMTRESRPKVLSIVNQSVKMGDLSAAHTRFQLKASPRIN